MTIYDKPRATFEPDYGQCGEVWVHGAFEPSTDTVELILSESRDSASHILFLEQVLHTYSEDRWLIIGDNLSSHHRRDAKIALAALPEIQTLYLGKYAPWLNLIEPWWKQWKSLALKGRRFEDKLKLENSLWNALNYWHHHLHTHNWKYKLKSNCPLGAVTASLKVFSESTTKQRQISPT